MKLFRTLIKDETRRIFLMLDYLIWLLFDPSKFKKIKEKEIKKIIIINLGAIGELLITSSLLPVLKKVFNCKISFMIDNGKEVALKNNPHISEILINRSFKKNIEELEKRKFDMALIIFPVSIKYSLMCMFSKIKYIIGGIGGLKKGPAFFFTRKNFPIIKKHVFDDTFDIIRQIGINYKNPKIEFYISDEDKKMAKMKLKNLNVQNYILAHPGFGFSTEHRYPTRLWPLERYAKVINYVVENFPFKVLLSGSRNELLFSKRIIQIVKHKDRVVVTNGKFNFGELAYIVSKAKLLIGPSTCVTHLAEAFNIPVVELAGKGILYELSNGKKLYIWTPRVNKQRVLYHNEVCTGCDLMDCRRKTLECMKAISVEEVINAINDLLD